MYSKKKKQFEINSEQKKLNLSLGKESDLTEVTFGIQLKLLFERVPI